MWNRGLDDSGADHGPVEEAGRWAARAKWMRRAGRVGFASKAIVYFVVAALAIGAALGLVGFDPTDTRGALVRIGQGIFGRGLVLALSAGLLGLGLWFIVEAAWNPRPGGKALVGAVSRIGQAGGGIGYLAMAGWAAHHVIFRDPTQSSDALLKSSVAGLLGDPLGVVLISAAAAITLIVGLRQIYIGAFRVFESWLMLDRMRPALRRLAPRLGVVGFCTQGLLFTFIGGSLAVAVYEEQASDAKGFDGVLQTIGAMPYGHVALGAAGLGLLCYAAFAIVEGRFKRMNPHRPAPGRQVAARERRR